MRGTLLSIILMIIASVMMGCSDSIISCTEGGEECVIDGPGPDLDMVCNLDVSAQQKCDETYGWMDGLPFPIPIPIPDCSEYPTTGGVCEISFDFPDFP